MVTAGTTLGVHTLSAKAKAKGAGDKIRMGFIGLGNRGSQLLGNFMKNPHVEMAAFCDVYEPYTTRDRSLSISVIWIWGKFPAWVKALVPR